MGCVYITGVCLFCLSVWAVIQLTLMAFFYSLEASTLIEDVAEKNYSGTIDFLVKTKENYITVSKNCYYAAYSYVALIVVSWVVIFQGKHMDKKAAEKLLREEEVMN